MRTKLKQALFDAANQAESWDGGARGREADVAREKIARWRALANNDVIKRTSTANYAQILLSVIKK